MKRPRLQEPPVQKRPSKTGECLTQGPRFIRYDRISYHFCKRFLAAVTSTILASHVVLVAFLITVFCNLLGCHHPCAHVLPRRRQFGVVTQKRNPKWVQMALNGSN